MISQYNVHTNLSAWIHKLFNSMIPHWRAILLTKAVNTWALSLGGPGLNCEEHNDGKSTFINKNPFSGSSVLGGPNSYNYLIFHYHI